MARDWRERDHPRNPRNGEFVDKIGGAGWAQRISDSIGSRYDPPAGDFTGGESGDYGFEDDIGHLFTDQPVIRGILGPIRPDAPKPSPGGEPIDIESLPAVGDPDFPDGYEITPDQLARSSQDITSGAYEIFALGGSDWEIPQRIDVLMDGSVTIHTMDGAFKVKPREVANIRYAEE